MCVIYRNSSRYVSLGNMFRQPFLSCCIEIDVNSKSFVVKSGLTSMNTNTEGVWLISTEYQGIAIRNVLNTVFGPSRINAGVQPLKRNLGPSSCSDDLNTSKGFAFPDCLDIRYTSHSKIVIRDWPRTSNAISKHLLGSIQLQKWINKSPHSALFWLRTSCNRSR